MKKIIPTPELTKRVNRPIPATNRRGEPLPPLCIEIVPARIAVRVLEVEEIDGILKEEGILWIPDKSKQQGQPVLQCVGLPERTVEGFIPGMPDRFQNLKVGDVFIGAGSGMQIPTNWRDISVFLVDPNIIVAFLVEDNFKVEEDDGVAA